MKEIFRTIEKVARSNATVLILGETGVGKELVAEALHRNSGRAERPFVKMNCAALHENLLESELFGHERGAFTGADRQRIGRFELANDGTLFLDEIGNMIAVDTGQGPARPPGARVRAPGRQPHDQGGRPARGRHEPNLEEAIARGEFREDLYYRLNVVNDHGAPAARAQGGHHPAGHALHATAAASELKKDVRGIEPGRGARCSSATPGPATSASSKNMIERAVLHVRGTVHQPGRLEPAAGPDAVARTARRPRSTCACRRAAIELEDLEKQAILEALRINNWVQKDAATLPGRSPRG